MTASDTPADLADAAPLSDEARFERAYQDYLEGRYDRCRRDAMAVYERQKGVDAPLAGRSALLLAHLSLWLMNHPEADVWCERALTELEPIDTRSARDNRTLLWILRAGCAAAQANYGPAVAWLHHGLSLIDDAIDPGTCASIHTAVAVAYDNLGMFEHSFRACETAYQLDRNHPSVELRQLRLSNLVDGGLKLFRLQSIAGVPQAADLGHRLTEWVDALEAFTHELDTREARFSHAYYAASWALYQGDAATALRHVQQIAASEPCDDDRSVRLLAETEADALLQLGRPEEALAVARRHQALVDAQLAKTGLLELVSQEVWYRVLGQPEAAATACRMMDARRALTCEAVIAAHIQLAAARFGVQSLNVENTQLRAHNEGLREERAALVGQAQTDALTGLDNRAALDAAFPDAVRNRRINALVVIDLDHFKAINDTHGHLVGDQVLKKVAALLRQSLRLGDRAARYGGEEFVVLLSVSDRDALAASLDRLRRTVADADWTECFTHRTVTFSAGAVLLKPEDSLSSAVDRADRRLYRAKNAGRNQVWVDDLGPVRLPPA